MKPNLHPWINSPEAVKAAESGARMALSLMPVAGYRAGADELRAQAMEILVQCALPPRNRLPEDGVCSAEDCPNTLEKVRKGSKFCSPACRMRHAKRAERTRNGSAKKVAEALPAVPQSHIGAMWGWPEDEMTRRCVRTVGFVLRNWLVTSRHLFRESPATETLSNMSLAAETPEPAPVEVLSDYLSGFRGVRVTGSETFAELVEAAVNLGVIDAAQASKALAA